MKCALLIIDLQKEYYCGLAEKSMNEACEYINEMIPYFRKNKLPVIWIQDVDEASGVIPGSRGFEFIDLLKPLKEEYSIHKYYGNSFNKTELHSILKKENIDTPILCGYAAENCVLSTYRGALDLDLHPVILQNGIASSRTGAVSFVSEISQLISYEILTRVIED